MHAGNAAPPYSFFGIGWLGGAVTGGYLSVVLADSLARGGVPMLEVGAVLAIGAVPLTFMALWAPVVDSRGDSLAWLVGGAALATLAMVTSLMLAHDVAHVPAIKCLAFLASFGYSLASMSGKRLVVERVAPDRRPAAAGWLSAGIGAGYAIAGVLLAIQSRVSKPTLCAILAVMVFVPPLASAWRLRRSAQLVEREPRSLGSVVLTTWRLLATSRGRLAVGICLLPVGINAAGAISSALGQSFGVTAEVVGMANGTAGALLGAVGGLSGGYLCQWIGPRGGWVIAGAGMIAASLVAAPLPHDSASYVPLVFAWSFCLAAANAAIYGVVFRILDPAAASTQAALFVGLMNAPNLYLPLVGGWCFDHLGLTGLLLADAAVGLIGLAAYALLARTVGESWRHEGAVERGT